MKRKTRHKSPTGKPHSSSQHRRSTTYPLDLLTSLILLPFLLSAGLVIALHTSFSTNLKDNLAHFLETELIRQIKLAQNELESIAPNLGKNSQLLEAMAQQDLATLKTLEITLAKGNSDIINVQLFPKDNLKSIDTGISFTTQDMIRRLEREENVHLELVKSPSQMEIRHGTLLRDTYGKAIGSLLVTLKQSAFHKYFSQIPPEIGYFSIVQQTRNQQIPWLSSNPTAPEGPLLTSPLDSTGDGINNWDIHYSTGTQFSALTHEIVMGLVGWVATSLLLLAIVITSRHRLLTRVEKNLQKLVHQLKGNRTQTNDIEYTVDGFEAAYRHLKNSMDALKQKQTGQATPKHANSKLSGLTQNSPSAQHTFEDQSLLDMDLDLADDDLFESIDSLENQNMTDTPTPSAQTVPAEIFRQYDIRGIVGETLNADIIELIGKAIGSTCLEKGDNSVVIGRDGRLSSPVLAQALSAGIQSSGCNVIDIGVVPTPLVYFAAKTLKTESGVMITGSHNPSNYNGLKIVIKGQTIYGEQIQHLYNLINHQNFKVGNGSYNTSDITDHYLTRVTEDVAVARPLKVVVDAGNGVAGPLSVSLLHNLGCEVVELYCDIDGHFPNHHPDPSKPENLSDLITAMHEHHADLGLAFDGDGDRLGVVTPNGKIIYPDRLLMLYARDILSRNAGGEIIFDIKCTSDLNELITSLGGRPIMWKTGHSLIKAKLKETGALIAGEMSGHIFFNDRWYGFDDAIYSAARLLEILSIETQDLDTLMGTLPEKISTPEINIPVTEESKFEIIEALTRSGEFQGHVVTLDGIRVDYKNGWGLVRASNTTPNLVARFEADTDENLRLIQEEFKTNLLNVNNNLGLPF